MWTLQYFFWKLRQNYCPPKHKNNCPQKLFIIPLEQQFLIQQIIALCSWDSFRSVFSHLWSCQTRAVSNEEQDIVAGVWYVICYMVSFNSKFKICNLSIYGQRDPKTAIVICVVCYITAAQCVCWHWCCVRIKRARCPHRLRTGENKSRNAQRFPFHM